MKNLVCTQVQPVEFQWLSYSGMTSIALIEG